VNALALAWIGKAAVFRDLLFVNSCIVGNAEADHEFVLALALLRSQRSWLRQNLKNNRGTIGEHRRGENSPCDPKPSQTDNRLSLSAVVDSADFKTLNMSAKRL
jgi:hypothetical protein